MDEYTPRNPGDVSDMERRLSSWRPGAQGLDADAMLFAAGLAAGKSGRARLLAPTLCGLLAALALGLGAWGLTERFERQSLASHLRENAPLPETSIADLREPSYTPSPGDYFSLRRLAEQDPNRLLASLQPAGPNAPEPPPPETTILRAGQRDGSLYQ